MQTLISDGTGSITEDYPVVPGQKYSLYVRKADADAPAGGNVDFFHKGDDLDPIIDANGEPVLFDFGTAADGLAIEFIAHTSRLAVSGVGMGAAKQVRFSLVPTLR